MVGASEANAAGLKAAAGDGRAEGCDTEGGSGEHLIVLVSASADNVDAATDLVCVEEKLVQQQVEVEVGPSRIGIVKS